MLNDFCVKIISQIDKGHANSRNVGLSHAQGECVLFVDSNDFLSENSLNRIYGDVESNEYIGRDNARNFTLKHVQGEYLYMKSADCLLNLNVFEDFNSILKSKNLDCLMFKEKIYDVENDEYCERNHNNMSELSEFVKGDIFNFNDIGDLIFNINVVPWYNCYKTMFIINSGAEFR